MKKRELEDWEKVECLALKDAVDAFNAGKSRRDMLTQGRIADALGINQGSVSSYLNGYNALNVKVASVIANLISVPIESFSPRLANELSALVTAPKSIDSHGRGENSYAKESNVIAGDFSQQRLRKGEIVISQYDVRATMGSGQVPTDYVETIRNIVLNESYLRSQGVAYTALSNLAVITAFDQSMEGTFSDGDPIIIDRGVKEFIGDGIYVFTWDNLLYIKRLQKDSSATLDMISDNPSHKDRIITTAEINIHARVLLAWNARKL